MIRFCVCVINYAIRFSTMFMKLSWKKFNTSPELWERFNQAYMLRTVIQNIAHSKKYLLSL